MWPERPPLRRPATPSRHTHTRHRGKPRGKLHCELHLCVEAQPSRAGGDISVLRADTTLYVKSRHARLTKARSMYDMHALGLFCTLKVSSVNQAQHGGDCRFGPPRFLRHCAVRRRSTRAARRTQLAAGRWRGASSGSSGGGGRPWRWRCQRRHEWRQLEQGVALAHADGSIGSTRTWRCASTATTVRRG